MTGKVDKIRRYNLSCFYEINTIEQNKIHEFANSATYKQKQICPFLPYLRSAWVPSPA